MKKTMSILAIAGLVLALAPAAQAALIIYVDDSSGTQIDFTWNGTIGDSGTVTKTDTGGSADQIVPENGQVQFANANTNFSEGQWYTGTRYAYGDGGAYSLFTVTSNIPFHVNPDGTLRVGKIGGDAGTVYPDLATDTFTGSFSLTGTFATYGLFNTGGTALPTPLWSATTGTGAISFQAIPEPATMSVLAIGGLALLRRRKRA